MTIVHISDLDVLTTEPESLTVGRLKLAVRELRERLHLQTVRSQSAESERDAARAEVKALREALIRAQYRSPRADMVAECIGCGARGPINERLRKMEPDPCEVDCYIARALTPGETR